MAENLTIVCVKHGPLYGAEYVNILLDMVSRNLSSAVTYKFACFTDDATGLNPAIDVRPLPEGLKGWWNKLYLFKEGVFKEGERVLYFDLDTLVLDRLDEIASYSGEFAILRDFYRPRGYQSAVMAWKGGWGSYIWAEYEKAGSPDVFGGDQAWIERMVSKADLLQDLFPGLIGSYKVDCWNGPKEGLSIVCFHGEPKAHNCGAEWVADVWKVGGSLKREILPANLDRSIPVFCNTEDDTIFRNIGLSVERDLPWLILTDEPKPGKVLIVGGGPSVRAFLPRIKREQENGAVIFAINGSMRMLNEIGCPVDHFVLLDARPENLRFVQGEACHYLIASQCDPDVFDLLYKKPVTLWHPNYPGIEAFAGKREAALISGGTTVGLQAMSIAYCMGYRDIHLYGFDSSYSDGMGHAYPQPENDQDQIYEYTLGARKFRATAWMARQAMEFQTAAAQLAHGGAEVTVHGSGLLPEVARLMTLPQTDLAKAS